MLDIYHCCIFELRFYLYIFSNLNDSDFASPSTSSCQGAVGGFDPNLMQDNFDSKDMVVKNINELMNCSKC